MARAEQYQNCSPVFSRWEIEGEHLEVSEQESATLYRGKDCPTKVVLWVGLHWIRFGDSEPILADRSMVFDSGPSLGASVCYTRHPDVMPTAEERAENRRHLKMLCMELYGRVAVWPDEDPEEEMKKYAPKPRQKTRLG